MIFILDEDGTFDILQYADPELNKELPTDFLDELVLDETDCNADTKEEDRQEENDDDNTLGTNESPAAETIKTEETSEDSMMTAGTSDSKLPTTSVKSVEQKSQSDFQAKFLEFSQMRKEEPPPTPPRNQNLDVKSPSIKEGQVEKSSTIQNSRHIAALLQSSPDHVNPDGSKSVVPHGFVSKPVHSFVGSPMKTEPDLQHPSNSQAVIRELQKDISPSSSLSNLSASSPKIQSSMQSGNMSNSPIDPSLAPMMIDRSRPPSSKPGQMSTMLPSPKDNLPKSGLSSPRTPTAQSPFGQVTGQQAAAQLARHSPMSVSTVQSPFSPSAPGYPQSLPSANASGSVSSSAGHTPPSAPPSRTQSPFLTGVDRVIPFNPNSQAAQTIVPSPGQTSPVMNFNQFGRGTVQSLNQYMQGTYGQPQTHVPPRGGVLTPNSVLYGQPVANQHFIKHAGSDSTACINASSATGVAPTSSTTPFSTFTHTQSTLGSQTATGKVSWPPFNAPNNQATPQAAQGTDPPFEPSMVSRSFYPTSTQNTSGIYTGQGGQQGLYFQSEGQQMGIRTGLSQTLDPTAIANTTTVSPAAGMHRSPTPFPPNHPSLATNAHIQPTGAHMPVMPANYPLQNQGSRPIAHPRTPQEQPLLIQDLLEEVTKFILSVCK